MHVWRHVRAWDAACVSVMVCLCHWPPSLCWTCLGTLLLCTLCWLAFSLADAWSVQLTTAGAVGGCVISSECTASHGPSSCARTWKGHQPSMPEQGVPAGLGIEALIGASMSDVHLSHLFMASCTPCTTACTNAAGAVHAAHACVSAVMSC